MNGSLWTAARPDSSKNTWRLSIGVAIAIGAISLVAHNIAWTGSAQAHTGGQVVASVLASLVGVALLGKYSVGGKQRYLLLGTGFIGTAALDLFQGIVSVPSVAESIGDLESVTTISWYSSRLYLASFALAACAVVVRPGLRRHARATIVTPAAVFAVIILMAAALFIDLPGFLKSSAAVGRPAEVLTGVMFLVAFAGFARAGVGSLSVVNSWIAISLMVNAQIQILFMALSQRMLDGDYAAAHALKLLAYGLVSVGVAVDAHRAYQQERRVSVQLGGVNDDLNRRNLELTTARNDLASLTKLAAIASYSVAVADNFDEFAEELRKRVPADRIVIVSANDDLSISRVERVWGRGIRDRKVGRMLRTKGRLMEDVLGRGETVVFDEKTVLEAALRDPRLQDDIDAGFKSWISTPVIARGKVIGALMVRSMKANAYGERDISFMEQVAAQIAGPLSVSRLGKDFLDGDKMDDVA